MRADFVFCMPGHPSSQKQAINCEMARIGVMTSPEYRNKKFGMGLATSSNIYSVRNGCLSRQRFRKNQKPFEGTYESYEKIIWMDSDNIFSTKDILRLLSHDVDIVAAWYRYGVYDISGLGEDNKTACGFWDYENGYNKTRPIKIGEILKLPRNEKGLIEVDYSGLGLMIIKKGVFEAIGYPWFRSWVYEWKEDGVEMADIMTDDAGFCWMAKQKGFKIMIDPEVRISHEKKVCI
jgi:hypothetical protein